MTKLEDHANQADISSLQVRTFMNREMVSIPSDSTIRNAIKAFQEGHVSVAPVMSGTRLAGIISEHDLLLLAASKELDAPIEYRTEAITIDADATFKEALILFYKHHVRRLPVLDATGRMVGIISRIDILSRFIT